MIHEIMIETHRRNELIDITQQIAEKVSGISEGIVTLFVAHTTCAVTINENADPDVKRDLLYKLSDLVPENDDYRHAEGNSDSHLKASLIGSSETIPIKDSKLMLGTWQGIYFCEFDGPRKRRLIIKITE